MKGRSPGERRVLYDWNLKRMPNKSCAQTSTGEEEDPPNEAIDKSKTISECDEHERSENRVKTSASDEEFNSFVFFLLHKKILLSLSSCFTTSKKIGNRDKRAVVSVDVLKKRDVKTCQR